MRRVVPILLALVLMPLYATAASYRCAYDGVTRSACCCPASQTGPKHGPAEPTSRLRSACCCTVTQAASAAPSHRTSQPASVDVVPPVLAIEVAAPQPWSCAVAVAARPRAQAPPDTLLSRRCSLLL